MTQQFLYIPIEMHVFIQEERVYLRIFKVFFVVIKNEKECNTKTLENKSVVVDSYDRKANNNTEE